MRAIRDLFMRNIRAALLLAALGIPMPALAQEMPEITIATAVGNMAYSAVWIAEQLKYFEQEGVRGKITVAGGGAPCQSAVVGRSTHFCASSSEGLILANQEGASLIAVQAHNRNMTLGITVRKAIVDKFKLTRKSPLNERLKVLTQLGTIGATSPGAVSEQIFKFLVKKTGADPAKLKFAYLGGSELVAAMANDIIDGLAQSPPQAESAEAMGKGYVLIPLGLGEVPELTNYPYLVLMSAPTGPSKILSWLPRRRVRSLAEARYFIPLPSRQRPHCAHIAFPTPKGWTTIFSTWPTHWYPTRSHRGAT